MVALLWTFGFVLLLTAPAIYNWADGQRAYRRECREFRNRYPAMPD